VALTVAAALKIDFTAFGCPVRNHPHRRKGRLLLPAANDTQALATNIAVGA
jgi:hypothetical protein